MHRSVFVPLSIALLGATALAQSVVAQPCPPGYRGTYPKCIPSPAATHAMKAVVQYHGGETRSAGHVAYPNEQEMVDSRRGRPAAGGPRETHATGAETRAIIFVGGRNAINSQPVPPGHSPDTSAINSQPVPPGHSLRRIPHPAAPIETLGH